LRFACVPYPCRLWKNGGTIISSQETRSELSPEDIAAINEAIHS